MREIKFRAWDVFTKKMWHWEDHNAFSTERGSIKQWFSDNDLRPMQFTGINDMHGNDIYEGDIVKYDTEELIVVAQVVWEEISSDGFPISGFILKPLRSEEYPEALEESIFEIIGNIYENPELLKN